MYIAGMYKEVANLRVPCLDQLLKEMEQMQQMEQRMKDLEDEVRQKTEKISYLKTEVEKYKRFLKEVTSEDIVSYMTYLERQLALSRREADRLWHECNPESQRLSIS